MSKEDAILNLIRDRFKNLEDNMSKGFTEVKSSMNEGFGLHNDRISTLEDEKSQRTGAMTTWGIVGTIVASGCASLVAYIKGP